MRNVNRTTTVDSSQYPEYSLVCLNKETTTMGLKQLRETAGLSQHELGKELAKRSGTSPQYAQPRISAYESGRNGIPLAVAMEITAILNKALRKKKSRTVATLEQLAKKQ